MKLAEKRSRSSANKSTHLSRSSNKTGRVNQAVEIRVVFTNHITKEAQEYKKRKLSNTSSKIVVSNLKKVVLL